MAVVARYLIDTSAAARMNEPAVADKLVELIDLGLVGTTAGLDAEALYSSRGGAEYEQLRSDRAQAYEYLPTHDEHWQVALEARRQLAVTGRHRAVGIADLLTAAIARDHGVTVVHYDADFDIVATVLDVRCVWVIPRKGD